MIAAARGVVRFIRTKLTGKIAFELLAVVFACLAASAAVFSASMLLIGRLAADQDRKAQAVLDDGYRLTLALQSGDLSTSDAQKIEVLADAVSKEKNYKIDIVDMKGNPVYRSGGDAGDEQASSAEAGVGTGGPAGEAVQYAVKLNDGLLIVSLKPAGQTGWISECIRNGLIPGLVALASVLTFILLFLLLTRRKIAYIEEIASGVKRISAGNLDFNIDTRGRDELSLLAEELNAMARELKDHFERERSLEKSKADLVMHVSHDLKSPLTAVIGYLSLLRDGGYGGGGAGSDYVDRAYNKSLRMKGLLQELLDFPGLTGEGAVLNRRRISLNNLLGQLIWEHMDDFERNGLSVVKRFPEEDVYADVDPEQIIRVFENLLSNALRYSPKPGDIGVSLEKNPEGPAVAISNQCEEMRREELERIFERFYRLDKSRAGETGGMGLGLAIAKRIVEMHEGRIWAEYSGGGVMFHVVLREPMQS